MRFAVLDAGCAMFRSTKVKPVTLKELKAFKYRINPEERQGAYGYYFIRPMSLYLTYAALRLGLRANQVTALQIVFGVLGSVCLAVPKPATMIAGILLLQFGFVLDNIDGEIARFRKEVSLTGKYLDAVGHVIVVPCMYFGLGIGTYFALGYFESIVFGFLAGFASLRLDYSILYHEAGLFIESNLDKAYDYYSRYEADDTAAENMYRRKNEDSPIRMLYALFAYPATMNIISVLVLADIFVSPISVLGRQVSLVYMFLAVYGFLLPVRRIITIRTLVRQRETEKKYLSMLSLLQGEEKKSTDTSPANPSS